MDPIGCVASVAGLIGVATKVAQFISKTKKGHKERQRLQMEVDGVYRTLLSIQDQFNTKDFDPDKPWFRCIRPLFRDGGDIPLLTQVLGDVVGKLEIESKSRVAEIVRSAKWPIESAEVDVLAARIEKLKANVTIAVTRANFEVSRDTHADVKQLRSAVSNAQLHQVINWICPLDFRSMQKSPQKRALEQTGAWLFGSKEFIGWTDRRAPSLWCYGIPGAGKTLLASAAFDKLKAKYSDQRSLIVIIFFDFNDKDTHSTEMVLSTLIRQALESRKEMNDEIRKLFDGSQASSLAGRPSLEDLQTVIKAELNHFDQIFVILDGLDEIPSEKIRSDVLNEVEALGPRLQLMVSSRPLLDIKTWFCDPTRDHRCHIPTSVMGIRLSAEETSQHDQNDRIDYDADDGDTDSIERTTWDDQVRLGCDICLFDDLNGLVAYQPACYGCSECDISLCGVCYDQRNTCVGCDGDKARIFYIWPQQIEIKAHPGDLELYVKWRIAQSPTHDRIFKKAATAGHDLWEEIVQAVVASSSQMFLLAKFHVDKLLDMGTPREMLRSVRDLNDDIHVIYEDVFKRIATFPVATHIMQLIEIVAYARKPLGTLALEHAVAVAQGSADINLLDLPDACDLVNKCLGLLIIDNDVVRLSHETVGYYVRKRTLGNPKGGDVMMAKMCLTYLDRPAMRKPSGGPERLQRLEARSQEFPLLSYAAIHWGRHACLADTETISSLAQSLLQDPACVASIAQIMWYDDLERGSGWDAEDDVSGIHLAAYFGLTEVLSHLLANGENIDSIDCMGTTALMYALGSGHDEAVSILIHAKADASLRCKRGRTALHRAIDRLSLSAVLQLVRSCDDIAVNAIDDFSLGLSALHILAARGETEILNGLLSRGDIDINMVDNTKNKDPALHHAVLSRKTETLKRLLADNRLQINKTNSALETALCIAGCYDNYEAVTELLDHGADSSIIDLHGGPALLRAIDYNSINSVRLMMESGVDYHFVDLFRRGVLHGCAVNNRPQILRYLLTTKSDLDVNVQGDRGETPLHDAAANGYSKVVITLLDFGARTDVRDNGGRTPLRTAKEANHEQIFRMLTETRKKEQSAAAMLLSQNVTEPDSPLHTHVIHPDTLTLDEPLPIHVAVRSLDTVALESYLTALGDDVSLVVNQLDIDQHSPVAHIAVAHRRNESLRLLIKHGADLGKVDMWGNTALHMAAVVNNLEATRILLQCKVEVNVENRQYLTPLELAIPCWQDMMEICFLLIKHGAIARKEDRRLIRVLRAAVENNELEVVEMLCALGVPCNTKIGGSSTLYQLAKKKGLTTIAEFLFDAMQQRKAQDHNTLGVSLATQGEDSDSQIINTEIKHWSKPEEHNTPDVLLATENFESDKPVIPTKTKGWSFAINSLLSQPRLTYREFYLLGIIVILLIYVGLR